MTATTVSRRQMLASVGGHPAAVDATAHDPAIAAVGRHRAVMQAWLAEDDEALSAELLEAEQDACIAWLTTPPTTMAGVIATLEHAIMRDYEHTILLESAHYHGERLDAAEQFPAMIAAALRKIVS
jgi:hypothetical protein